MASEPATERDDGGVREGVAMRDAAPMAQGGASVGGVILGMAALALVAIVAFFLLSQIPNDSLRVSAVTGAAATLADSASRAARSVGDAAAPER